MTGTLTGTGELTVTGTATFNASTYTESGAGTTLVEGGASLTATNGLNMTINSRMLELQGTSTATGTTGGNITFFSAGQLRIDSGATFNDESSTPGPP